MIEVPARVLPKLLTPKGMYNDIQSAVYNMCHVGFWLTWKREKIEKERACL